VSDEATEGLMSEEVPHPPGAANLKALGRLGRWVKVKKLVW